jgi:hypothetical protein
MYQQVLIYKGGVALPLKWVIAPIALNVCRAISLVVILGTTPAANAALTMSLIRATILQREFVSTSIKPTTIAYLLNAHGSV